MALSRTIRLISDDCVSGPCQNEGTCTSSINGYTCQCPDQYYGKNCHIHCPCIAGTCVNISPGDISNSGVFVDGVLINAKPVYPESGVVLACNCSRGMEGAYCNKSIDDCVPGACMNGGTCIDGDDSYNCLCPPGYFGETCGNRHLPKEEDSLVAKITLGVLIPLVVVFITALVIYGIYMYRHPDKFGRSATYKNYVIAREFVRRSIRRMSGRRPREKLVANGSKGDEKDPNSDKYTDASQVNLGFQDGDDKQYKPAVPVYTRENSEFYNLSPDNAAVVAGPNTYDMIERSKQDDVHDYEQMKPANEKPQRQLGRAYRNKSTGGSGPATPGVEKHVPSPRTPTDNPAMPTPRTSNANYSSPSPRSPPTNMQVPSPRNAPSQLMMPSSGQYQSEGQVRPPSISDDEGRGFGYKPKSPSGTGPYEQQGHSPYPDIQRNDHNPRGRGPSVSSDKNAQYRDPRENTQHQGRDPGYNSRGRGPEASRRQYPGETDYRSRSQDGQSYDPVDRGNMYDNTVRDQRYNQRDRYNTNPDPQDRYADYEGRSPGYSQQRGRDDLSPGGYSKNRSDDRYNMDYKQPPPSDRYQTPRGIANDRYNDGYEMPYNQGKSPRYTDEGQFQYGNRQQRSPADRDSDHARVVFPVSDGMDEVTI
ncbi:hypothetical protein FSP39_004882 [Pinctada imbricata]|uniref:EGF-like domain-containing protein n=1 Tax=Pinctada imbricata TaxID=66713 RepID=A0AA89BVQ5_PINIB|nr:hypothetical protein FSP39_004882 [Pinctada imbricata]